MIKKLIENAVHGIRASEIIERTGFKENSVRGTLSALKKSTAPILAATSGPRTGKRTAGIAGLPKIRAASAASSSSRKRLCGKVEDRKITIPFGQEGVDQARSAAADIDNRSRLRRSRCPDEF
jgi:hypothetical protein